MRKKFYTKKYILEGLYGVDTFTEVSELFRLDYREVKDTNQELARKLFQKYVLAITFRSSPNSISTNLGTFRRIIEEEGGEYKEQILDYFWFHRLYPFISEERAKKKAKEKIGK